MIKSEIRRQSFLDFRAGLSKLKKMRGAARAPKGWVHLYRKGLGMTQLQLAKRMGLHQSNVKQLEDKESEGRANLQSLKRAAEAMNCELVYAFVPREDVKIFVEKEADKKARKIAGETFQNMALEGQLPAEADREKIIRDIKQSLLEKMDSRIWE